MQYRAVQCAVQSSVLYNSIIHCTALIGPVRCMYCTVPSEVQCNDPKQRFATLGERESPQGTFNALSAQHHTTLHCTAPHCTVNRHTKLWYTAPNPTAPHITTQTSLPSTTPHCTTQLNTALHCTVHHHTTLHYTVPHQHSLHRTTYSSLPDTTPPCTIRKVKTIFVKNFLPNRY